MSSARGGNSSARGGNKRAPTPPAAAPATAKDKAKATKSKEKRPRASSVGRRASNKSGSAAAAKLEPSTAVGAATILQRRWRAVLAQRKAREELHLLRQFDLLMAEVRLECLQQRAARLAAEARAESALKLQCATRRRLARRALHGAAATRLQCAARQKLARKAAHDAYWSYAFGLLNQDSAERLQRWWRAVLARRRAQVDLALLRDWDALQVGVRAACEARAAAARRLQRAARSHSVAQWLGAMCRGADRDAAPSGFSEEGLGSADNPFSDDFSGMHEHRRRVEAAHGRATPGGTKRLRTYGKISLGAMAHALPGQLATLFNTLRFVDAVNALIERRVVEVTEGSTVGGVGVYDCVQYEDLMAWGDKALQARFGGCTQYLKAAKRFGFLHYRGEMLHEGTSKRAVLQSYSLGMDRRALLTAALEQPQRVVPALYDAQGGNRRSLDTAKAKLAQLILSEGSPFRQPLVDFLRGSFEQELRECTFLLDDEFWPDSGGEGGSSEDEEDKSLKAVADAAAVARVRDAHDYFDVLGLPRDCSRSDVKRAFIKLSKEVHPDKNGAKGANEAFDRLNTAKQTLGDDEVRAAYASANPPKAAAAREWARSMDAATGKAMWRQG